MARSKSLRCALKAGQHVAIDVPEAVELDLIAQDIPLDILYEDRDVIVINKAANIVVHPSPGHESGTLVNALLHHCGDLSGIGGVLRPGIVHRLDKLTTGVMVCTKNDKAHLCLAEQFHDHTIERRYYALCHGRIKEDGTFDTLHGRHPRDRKRFSSKVKDGRRAVTHYRVLEDFGEARVW